MKNKNYKFSKAIPTKIGWYWIYDGHKAAFLLKLRPLEDRLEARKPFSNDVFVLTGEFSFAPGLSPELPLQSEMEKMWK